MTNDPQIDQMTLGELEALISQQAQRLTESDDIADTEAQLAALNATIARLESQDIPVPESLREVKLDLNRKLSSRRSASDILEKVKARLVDLVRMIPDGAVTAGLLETAGAGINLPDLYISIPERRVVVQGDDIHLTPKEFRLLVFLASTPNVVHTREEIMEEVWESTSRTSDHRTVDTHIKRLRNKLEEGRALPWRIDTVWGSGYRFVIDHNQPESEHRHVG